MVVKSPSSTPQDMVLFEGQFAARGFDCLIGVDEAGRGPLAGPVVAAAVCLKTAAFDYKVADSKKLSPRQRELAFNEITEKATIGIGVMSEVVIDQQNILQATFLAMTNAVQQLLARLALHQPQLPSADKICLLIDGNRFSSELPYAVQTVVKGDAKVLSIACASIVAKVVRDRMIGMYDKVYPQYGFAQHKGYPTRQHKAILKEQGPSAIHRRSFRWD